MLNINKVMLTGRLTRDPETKYLPSGMAVTNLGLAVNRRFQDRNGEWKDETSFIDVEVWGKAAERCAETMRKGQPVYVEGRLKQDSWERDGVKQSKIRVNADVVRSFEVPQRGGQGGDYGDGGGDYGSSEPQQQSSSPQQGPSAGKSGQASDGLNFGRSGGDQATSDDMPF